MVFAIKQEKFEGPFELLIELVEKEKLAISDISLAKVADEYLAYVKTLNKIDPEQVADFLIIAAQLILIKSRSLLPTIALSKKEEGSIEELEKRLTEFKILRECAGELKKIYSEKPTIISRESLIDANSVFYLPPKLTLIKVQDAFALFLSTLPNIQKLAEEKLKRIISLQEKIAEIRIFLASSIEKAFSELISGSKEKIEIIVSFLAVLELTRQKFINVNQDSLFSDITIKRL